MRSLICLLTLFFSAHSFSQTNESYAFPIKTTFKIGESHSYEVSEIFRVDNLFLPIRSQVESSVNFHVFDTADGGYWLYYKVNIHSVKQRKDSSAYIIANLIDGIKLYVYAKNGLILVDSSIYHRTRNNVAEKLDSIATHQLFGKKTSQFVKYLQTVLKNEAGLGYLLGPLMVFETYYSSGVYKKFRLTTDGTAHDILHKSMFGGYIEKEWTRTSKDSSVHLNYVFAGDPTPVERYLKSLHEGFAVINDIKTNKHKSPPVIQYIKDYTFHIQPGNAFPSYLFEKRIIEYFFRSVNKIEMKEMLIQNE